MPLLSRWLRSRGDLTNKMQPVKPITEYFAPAPDHWRPLDYYWCTYVLKYSLNALLLTYTRDFYSVCCIWNIYLQNNIAHENLNTLWCVCLWSANAVTTSNRIVISHSLQPTSGLKLICREMKTLLIGELQGCCAWRRCFGGCYHAITAQRSCCRVGDVNDVTLSGRTSLQKLYH